MKRFTGLKFLFAALLFCQEVKSQPLKLRYDSLIIIEFNQFIDFRSQNAQWIANDIYVIYNLELYKLLTKESDLYYFKIKDSLNSKTIKYILNSKGNKDFKLTYMDSTAANELINTIDSGSLIKNVIKNNPNYLYTTSRIKNYLFCTYQLENYETKISKYDGHAFYLSNYLLPIWKGKFIFILK